MCWQKIERECKRRTREIMRMMRKQNVVCQTHNRNQHTLRLRTENTLQADYWTKSFEFFLSTEFIILSLYTNISRIILLALILCFEPQFIGWRLRFLLHSHIICEYLWECCWFWWGTLKIWHKPILCAIFWWPLAQIARNPS